MLIPFLDWKQNLNLIGGEMDDNYLERLKELLKDFRRIEDLNTPSWVIEELISILISKREDELYSNDAIWK